MRCSAKLACIDPVEVAKFWPLARELVKSAIDRTRLSDFEPIEREVLAGLQLLWLAHDGKRVEAAAVTQLATIADRKVCTIVACGGHGRPRWLHLISGIEDFAKAEGCQTMRIGGRPGWERVLEGYQAKFVILERELA